MNKIVFTPGFVYRGNLRDGGQVTIIRLPDAKLWDVVKDGEILASVSDRAELESRMGAFTEVEVLG